MMIIQKLNDVGEVEYNSEEIDQRWRNGKMKEKLIDDD